MNKRFIIMLSIALILAFLAAWVANRWVQARVLPDTVLTVVVAAVEIPFGVKLEESQVKLIPWSGGATPQGSYSAKNQVVGRVSMNKFYPDEIITEKRISEYLGGSTLSALITKGSRAMSVRVDDVVGVAGFILPGNKVDIISTKKERTDHRSSTVTLLQNIKVLAVDQEASQEKEKPAIVRAVTLELTPEQAEIMSQAQEDKIQLTLRNPLDNEVEAAPAKEDVKIQPVEKIIAKKSVRKVVSW